jgi:DNA polymerase
MTDFSSLAKVKGSVTSCTNCNLCKDRLNSVPGKGDPKSDIIFVGEAPGRNEDKSGEPFVGEAGKKLTIALEHAGLSRDKVYITNVVKCRPPNNRVPTQEERDMCRKYLDSEIRLIKPKIICVMGNTAFGSLLGGDSITKNRGKTVIKDGQKYFLTVHPAAAIYNKGLLEVLKKDMITLTNLVRQKTIDGM